MAAVAAPASSIKQAAGSMLMLLSPAQSSRVFIVERGSLPTSLLAVWVKGVAVLGGQWVQGDRLSHMGLALYAPSIERIARQAGPREKGFILVGDMSLKREGGGFSILPQPHCRTFDRTSGRGEGCPVFQI